MKDPRILVVADDEEYLGHLTRFIGTRFPRATIDRAESAEEAFARMEDAAYDMIISDHRLTESDGIDVLIHARDAQPRAVRVLITGNSDLDMAVRAIKGGHVHTFLEKPVHGDVLVAALEKALATRATIHEHPTRGDILLVEDDPEIRRLVVSYFGLVMPEVHVEAVPTGREGLISIAKHRVDVILADYHLPDMTGTEFLAEAQHEAPLARTAIITGSPPHDLANDTQRGRIADRLFIKPIDMDSFARTVQHLLPKR